MKNNAFESKNFFKTACLFESSLLIISFFLGWLTGVDPFASLFFSEKALITGIFASLPLLIIYFALQQVSYAPLKKISSLLHETLGAALFHRHWTDLLVLALIAGFTEEVLFRGFLQPWLENVFNIGAGLLISNLIFALVHAVTPLYALLALMIVLYLGAFLDVDGQRNLLTPIVIHSLYDFVVL